MPNRRTSILLRQTDDAAVLLLEIDKLESPAARGWCETCAQPPNCHIPWTRADLWSQYRLDSSLKTIRGVSFADVHFFGMSAFRAGGGRTVFHVTIWEWPQRKRQSAG